MHYFSNLFLLAVSITSIKNPCCCEYSTKTPDDGQWVCPRHVQFFAEIKSRDSASRWLLL